MMAGTIPSGNENIVRLREEMSNVMFGPGHAHEFREGQPFAPPTVEHWFGAFTPDAARIRVGSGDCATSLTPWTCPLLPCDYTAVAAKKFIHTRCDARDWLARLSGKTLECDCDKVTDDCWAMVLREAFIEFIGNNEDEFVYTFAVAEDEHEEAEMLPLEVYVTVPDIFEIGGVSESSVPRPPWCRKGACRGQYFGRSSV